MPSKTGRNLNSTARRSDIRRNTMGHNHAFYAWPRDRRGATVALFGVTASIALGFVGLATEGGSWYLTRRDAQNAADVAAHVGAMRLAYTADALGYTVASQRAHAVAAARDTATGNGFTHAQAATRVIVNIPPTTGPQAGNTGAVEVIVERDRARLISRIFVANGLQQIGARAVAAVQNDGPACLVGGVGTPLPSIGVSASGSTNVQMPNCAAASNAISSEAIRVGNAATLDALALVSAGGCLGCEGNVTTNALPATNPFIALDRKTLPTFTNANCFSGPIPRNGTVNSSITINPPPAGQAICALDIRGANTVVTLTPGVYHFYDAAFNVTSGNVRCPACRPGNGITMVFTGVNALGPQINANATVTLVGGSASDPDYAGILFFRDPRARTGDQGNPPVQINGGIATSLTGGMYFPNAQVRYSGNSGNSLCSVLVGGTVVMTGNSGLSTTGCEDLGLGGIAPQTRVVRLVE